MKSALQKTILFMLSALAVYLLVFAFLYYVNPAGTRLVYRTSKGNVWKGGGTWVKYRKFDKHVRHDVLVIGSSHAYRGYDPRLFAEKGYSCYNLGSSAQSMMCTYEITRAYINDENCGLLIIDLYDRVFAAPPLESVSDIIHNVPDDKLAAEVALSARDIRAINMFTLRMFDRNAAIRDTDTCCYVSGYLPKEGFSKVPIQAKAVVYKSNPEQTRYLHKLLHQLKQEGIPCVITIHPQPGYFQPLNHAQFIRDVKQIADPIDVKVLDYTADKRFATANYYYDENHLNQAGVEMYNHILLRDLSQLGILPPPSLHYNKP